VSITSLNAILVVASVTVDTAVISLSGFVNNKTRLGLVINQNGIVTLKDVIITIFSQHLM